MAPSIVATGQLSPLGRDVTRCGDAEGLWELKWPTTIRLGQSLVVDWWFGK